MRTVVKLYNEIAGARSEVRARLYPSSLWIIDITEHSCGRNDALASAGLEAFEIEEDVKLMDGTEK
eukprot:SAG31_NODE_3584_length_4100_cov_1.957761_2_plen_66_part_00